jgi:hypothetical protein
VAEETAAAVKLGANKHMESGNMPEAKHVMIALAVVVVVLKFGLLLLHCFVFEVAFGERDFPARFPALNYKYDDCCCVKEHA